MRHRHFWTFLSIYSIIVNIRRTMANPLHVPLLNSRTNYGHLPCISNLTGERGICLFASTCTRAHGTHLGICMDGTYPASCCKIPGTPNVFTHNEDSAISAPRPFMTTPKTIESNEVPHYYPRPHSKPSLPVTTSTAKPAFNFSEHESNQDLAVKAISAIEKIIAELTKPVTNKPDGGYVNEVDHHVSTEDFETSDQVDFEMETTLPESITDPTESSVDFDGGSTSTEDSSEVSTTIFETQDEVSAETGGIKVEKNETLMVDSSTEKPTLPLATLHNILVLLFNGTFDVPPMEYFMNKTQKPILEGVTVPEETDFSTTQEFTTETTTSTEISSVENDVSQGFLSWNNTDFNEVCGNRLVREARVVGGTKSAFGEWPWQISLRKFKKESGDYQHICGASLLSKFWAITAAHCVLYIHPRILLLRMGDHDLDESNRMYPSIDRKVVIIVRHPQFDPVTYENDLALLRFDQPLTSIQPNILPICVPDDDETYVDHKAWVTGWGRLYYGNPVDCPEYSCKF